MGIFTFNNKKEKKNEKLHPESKFLVEIDGTKFKTVDYEGIIKTLELNEISQIIIETNDSGPWGTDVWWRILGNGEFLSVPGGATGESDMLKKFQLLPNFDNENLIKAMSSVEKAEFLVWRNI